jgi:hypothetical protein
VTDAHPAQSAASFSVNGCAERHSGIHESSRDGHAPRGDERHAVDGDLEQIGAHAAIRRTGENGAGSTFDASAVTSAAMISAVAVELVMPRPS